MTNPNTLEFPMTSELPPELTADVQPLVERMHQKTLDVCGDDLPNMDAMMRKF